MICRHCQQPIERCHNGAAHGWPCRGWVHSGGYHLCPSESFLPVAEPEPGTLPITEAPTSKPSREVA